MQEAEMISTMVRLYQLYLLCILLALSNNSMNWKLLRLIRRMYLGSRRLLFSKICNFRLQLHVERSNYQLSDLVCWILAMDRRRKSINAAFATAAGILKNCMQSTYHNSCKKPNVHTSCFSSKPVDCGLIFMPCTSKPSLDQGSKLFLIGTLKFGCHYLTSPSCDLRITSDTCGLLRDRNKGTLYMFSIAWT